MLPFQPGDRVWLAPDVFKGVYEPVPVTISHADDRTGMWVCLHENGNITCEMDADLYLTKDDACSHEIDVLEELLDRLKVTPTPEGWR